MSYRKSIIAGFTATEAMVAIVILGVLALVVIPPVINNVNDSDLKIEWRKDFSDLTQVAYSVVSDHKGSFANVCDNNDANCVRDQFSKYLQVTKVCLAGGTDITAGNTLGNCWKKSGIKALNGWQPLGYSPKNAFAGLVLSNGSYLMFVQYRKMCDAVSYSNTFTECGLLFIDVNGPKTPNTVGRDIFHMKMAADGLVPFGVEGDDYYGDCDPNNKAAGAFGFGCAAQWLSQ